MSGAGDRTEKPTAKRRNRAKEEGQFAQSQELTGVVVLAVALTAFNYTLGPGAGFKSLMNSLLQTAVQGEASQETLYRMIRQSGWFFLITVAPVLAAAAGASIIMSVGQGHSIIGANSTGLKWQHLNPVSGLTRLKGKINPVEWLKIILLVAFCGITLYRTMAQFWEKFVTLPAHDISGSNQILQAALTSLISTLVGGAVVLAVGDFFFQRHKFEKSLMMTKEEVKEDYKSLEGNPKVKGKIKQIQREQARRRMMTRIKDATVIVTNPTHYAVALEYKPDTMAAPRVVAKGMDFIAQAIKAEGRKHDIPMVENVQLARALYKSVEIEQDIPVELFKAVAEVLAFVFKSRKR